MRRTSHDVSIVREPEAGELAKFGNLPPLPASLTFERVKQDGKTIGIIRFNIWMPALANAIRRRDGFAAR
jgi:carboxyl-terminal processing protease